MASDRNERRRFEVGGDANLFRRCKRPQELQGILDQQIDCNGLTIDRQLICFDSGHVEEIMNETIHALGRAMEYAQLRSTGSMGLVLRDQVVEQELNGHLNGRERILEIVRNNCHQLLARAGGLFGSLAENGMVERERGEEAAARRRCGRG